MTTEITIPIKCNTVKKIKDSILFVSFWVIIVASILGLGLLIYKATLPGVMLSDTDVVVVITIGMIIALIVFVLLCVTCPYKFKCIQE